MAVCCGFLKWRAGILEGFRNDTVRVMVISVRNTRFREYLANCMFFGLKIVKIAKSYESVKKRLCIIHHGVSKLLWGMWAVLPEF